MKTEHDEMTTILTTAMLAELGGIPYEDAGDYETTPEFYNHIRADAEFRIERCGEQLVESYMENPIGTADGLREMGRLLADQYHRVAIQAVEDYADDGA